MSQALKKDEVNLSFIDGLRGILCLIVAFDHCVGIYAPFAKTTASQGSLVRFVAHTPLNLIYGGLPAVFIFFIMSGFVLSYRFNKTKNYDIARLGLLKRYVRLSVPVFFSYFFVYISMYPHLSLKNALYQSFYQVEFTHIDSNNPPLWSISWELYGSYIVFLMILAFGNSRNFIFFSFLFFVSFIYFGYDHYSFFMFGLMLSFLFANGKIGDLSKYLYIPLVSVGIILCSYPYPLAGLDLGWFYKIITFTDDRTKNYLTFIKYGSFILFFSILYSKALRTFFSKNVFLFFGRISFSIYLIHFPILMLIERLIKHHSAFFIILKTLLFFSFTIILSVAFEHFVDRKSIRISSLLAKKLYG